MFKGNRVCYAYLFKVVNMIPMTRKTRRKPVINIPEPNATYDLSLSNNATRCAKYENDNYLGTWSSTYSSTRPFIRKESKYITPVLKATT